MDVTVEIDREGHVRVTVSDEAGYNPEVIDTMCRQARETATLTHRDVCGRQRKPSS